MKNLLIVFVLFILGCNNQVEEKSELESLRDSIETKYQVYQDFAKAKFKLINLNLNKDLVKYEQLDTPYLSTVEYDFSGTWLSPKTHSTYDIFKVEKDSVVASGLYNAIADKVVSDTTGVRIKFIPTTNDGNLFYFQKSDTTLLFSKVNENRYLSLTDNRILIRI